MSDINKQHPKDENGLAHGQWIRYHDNGKLAYCYNFVHGIPHGLREAYYGDGTLFYIENYKSGIRYGFNYQPKLSKKRYYLWLI